MKILTFLEEYHDFLTSVIKENSQPTILGDFNILWTSPGHIDTQSIAEMLNTFNIHQLINFPTHKVGNTLDWIILRAEQSCSKTESEFLITAS